MHKLAVFGDICIDNYVDKNQSFIGGNSFNVAYHLMSLGANFVLFSPLGEDQYSSLIEDKILSLGIESELFRVNLPNQSITIRNSNDGDRTFSDYNGSILEHSYLPDFSNFSYIISPYFEEIRTLISKAIEENNKKMILDLAQANQISVLELTDLAKVSAYINIGAEKFPHELLLELSSECTFTVTLGDRGARLYKDNQFYNSHKPSFINVVDATGAGDSFFAYMINVLISTGFDLPNASQTLENACAYTFSTLLRFGGVPVKITTSLI